jgi:hypothetical protein
VFIPINIILSIFLSVLVGINISLSSKSITVAFIRSSRRYNSHSKRGISCSLLGASSGLFAACPTCAVNFIYILIGTGVTVTAAGSSVSADTVTIGTPPVIIYCYELHCTLSRTINNYKI